MTLNKSLIFILLLIVLGCKNSSGEMDTAVKEGDSLSFYLKTAYDESFPIAIRKQNNEKAISIISKLDNDSLKRKYLFKVANRYYNMSDLNNYKKISQQVVKLSQKASDTTTLAEAYINIADYYSLIFISDSAYQYYFNAEKLYKKLKDEKKAAKCLLSKSTIQFNEKDYVGSEKSALEALKLLKTKTDGELYQSYNLLGVIYNELNEFPKALEYHNKALSTLKHETQPSNSDLIPSSLNNIGLVYQNSKNHKKAIQYFEKALQQKNLKHISPVVYIYLKNNLGYSKLEIGDYTDIPEMFNETLVLSDSLNLITGDISSKMHLSKFYAIKKDTIKAQSLLLNAYHLSRKSGIQRDILASLKELSKIDPKNIGKYSNEYIRINDSLQLTERQNRNKLARIEFETDEIITQKNQLVEQRKTLIYIALSIILLGVFIFVIRFQAAKNRELKLVQEQQKANEEIYQLMLNQQNKIEEVRQSEKKRIAQELHDGILGKLFGTRMNLGGLNDKDDQATKSERLDYIDELKTLEQEIREISHDLNTEKTAVFNNFVLMVSNFIETQKKVCKAEITFSVAPEIEWNSVDNIAKINLYRILQESFQNINKYANAENVIVSFYVENHAIILKINDDGVGFNLNRKKKGIGLLNMESRIKDSDGKMEVVSAPGEGTMLKFELPVAA